MTADDDHLRDKARLLLQRERELFELRLRQEQIGVWLSIGQALPALFSHRDGRLAQAWDGIRKLLIGKLRLQRALLLELGPLELQPLAPVGPARPLAAAARGLLEARPAGCCNDPKAGDPGVAELAEVLGLHRFMWASIERPQLPPILMAAGFDAHKATFQSPFEPSDVAHFGNAAQHVQSLLGNALLIAELERVAQELRAANENLEQRVHERTRELAVRNRDLRLVLDTVDQALLTVSLEGRLAPERSSIADRWFGAYTGSPKLLEHVPADKRFAARFRLGLDALSENVLPRDLCLDQLPKRLQLGARHFDCRYLPIEEQGQLLGLLLVIDDVTDALARARQDAEKAELLAVFSALMRDKNGFLTFFEEAEQIMRRLAGEAPDSTWRKQLLHTLKGSSATMGLRRIAELCHAAESNLVEGGHGYAETFAELRSRWSEVRGTLRALVPAQPQHSLEVTEQQLSRLMETARELAAPKLLRQLEELRWEAGERPLRRLAQHAQVLAERLGKAPLRIEVQSDASRLEPNRWAPLWAALIHVVQNAVDHGLETAEQRSARGKPLSGRLLLRAERVGQDYQVEIADDGRGIDWAVIRNCCEARGLASATHADLLQALLSPDFTTRAEVSETSGRGIGLSVVANAVRDLSGSVQVESELGKGTRWTFVLPAEGTHPGDV
ncbi:MAG TPA: ATP-binding protein [Polyangiaceae bacterium]|nr:ATP-binding protein [Polyangiaceae bacterium]